MFSENKKKRVEGETRGQSNRIGKNTIFRGDVTSQADFRIDGTLEGTIETTGKIVIGKSGIIHGKISCENADIEGKFDGELKVKNLLTLKSTAFIEGNVTAGKLSVEIGATFNATCAMKSGIKDLNTGEEQKTNKTA